MRHGLYHRRVARGGPAAGHGPPRLHDVRHQVRHAVQHACVGGGGGRLGYFVRQSHSARIGSDFDINRTSYVISALHIKLHTLWLSNRVPVLKIGRVVSES